jgi:hypothetical protein
MTAKKCSKLAFIEANTSHISKRLNPEPSIRQSKIFTVFGKQEPRRKENPHYLSGQLNTKKNVNMSLKPKSRHILGTSIKI